MSVWVIVGTVFISYRRGDEPFAVAQLERYLDQALASDEVFRDTSDIAAGDDFLHAMDNAIRRYAVLMPIIGRGWDFQRLADPLDNVRWEIARALQLNKRILPVLVGSAAWPTVSQLPSSLRPLATLTYLPFRGGPDLERDQAEILRHLLAMRPVVLRGEVSGSFGFGSVLVRLDGLEIVSGSIRQDLIFGPRTLSPGKHLLEVNCSFGGIGRWSAHPFEVRKPGDWHVKLAWQRTSTSFSFTLTPPT